jgi:hypothetical protein
VTALIACPVCFGASDAPMAIATNMGIFLMLGVVAVMLASFAGFFVYLNRRAKALADGDHPATAGSHDSGSHGSQERDVRFGTNPQEGTA